MDNAARLALELGRFARLHHTIKMHLSSHTPGNMEWAALGVLGDVAKRGPLRQTSLAACSLLDQSTVSRHVAALVKAGLVERRPDPADGRASLLAATDEGMDAFAQFAGQRTRAVARMVSHWEADDVERFTAYLRRLVDEFEERRPEALEALANAHADTTPVDMASLRAVLGIPSQADAVLSDHAHAVLSDPAHAVLSDPAHAVLSDPAHAVPTAPIDLQAAPAAPRPTLEH